MSSPIPMPTEQAYSELQAAFDFFNERLFDGKLPPTLITFQREKRTEGYLAPKRFIDRSSGQMVDELAMNPSYFVVRPVRHILSVIAHEMVHQWQMEFGNPGRRRYHNKEWASKMESIGLMPSDTGKPGGARTGESMAHYIITGGKFDVACTELLSNHFTVTWLDRYAAERPQAPNPPNHAKGYIDDTDDIEAGEAEAEIPERQSEARPNQGLDDELGEVASLIELPSETATNKSNRWTYRCPQCAVNVLGKPNLIIRCGGEHCENAMFLRVR